MRIRLPRIEMTLCCVEAFHIVVAQHLRPRHSASRSRLQYQRWWTLCHSMMEKRAPRTGYPWHLEHSNVCKVNGFQWGGLGERVTVTGKCSVYTYVILVSHIVVHSRDVQYFLYLRFSLLKKNIGVYSAFKPENQVVQLPTYSCKHWHMLKEMNPRFLWCFSETWCKFYHMYTVWKYLQPLIRILPLLLRPVGVV